MQSRTVQLVLAMALTALAACNSDAPSNNGNNTTATNNSTTATNNSTTATNNSTTTTNNGTAPVPEDALAWELPAGAAETTKTEFEARVATGEVLPVSLRLLREQGMQLEAQEAGDRETISDFMLRNPDAELWIPEAADDAPNGDGNLRYTWTLPNGDPKEVTLHGERWALHTVAESLRFYPTRDNQFAMYKEMWTGLPLDLRNGLSLPDPMEIENSPTEYTDSVVRDLVATISQYALEVSPHRFTLSLKPAGYPATCDDESGAGAGTDRSGDCTRDANGLFAAANWPTKWLSTCVKDQGNRGTCVGMSAVSAIEQLVAQRDQQWVNLSEQALYNRMKLVWEREDYWDGFYSALSAGHLKASSWHIPFEQRWNYNPSPSRVDGVLVCKDTNCSTQSCRNECAANASWWYYLYSCEGYSETCGDYSHQTELVCYQGLDGAYTCGFVLPDQNADGEGHGSRDFSELWDQENRELSFARVILHLALSHPVVISVPLYASWWTSTDNTGLVPMPGGAGDAYRGAHAMHVLAYVDNDQLPSIAPQVPDGAGGGYFIVKNSWGNCFGDGGYVYMPYDYVRLYAYDVVAYLRLQ